MARLYHPASWSADAHVRQNGPGVSQLRHSVPQLHVAAYPKHTLSALERSRPGSVADLVTLWPARQSTVAPLSIVGSHVERADAHSIGNAQNVDRSDQSKILLRGNLIFPTATEEAAIEHSTVQRAREEERAVPTIPGGVSSLIQKTAAVQEIPIKPVACPSPDVQTSLEQSQEAQPYRRKSAFRRAFGESRLISPTRYSGQDQVSSPSENNSTTVLHQPRPQEPKSSFPAMLGRRKRLRVSWRNITRRIFPCFRFRFRFGSSQEALTVGQTQITDSETEDSPSTEESVEVDGTQVQVAGSALASDAATSSTSSPKPTVEGNLDDPEMGQGAPGHIAMSEPLYSTFSPKSEGKRPVERDFFSSTPDLGSTSSLPLADSQMELAPHEQLPNLGASSLSLAFASEIELRASLRKFRFSAKLETRDGSPNSQLALKNVHLAENDVQHLQLLWDRAKAQLFSSDSIPDHLRESVVDLILEVGFLLQGSIATLQKSRQELWLMKYQGLFGDEIPDGIDLDSLQANLSFILGPINQRKEQADIHNRKSANRISAFSAKSVLSVAHPSWDPEDEWYSTHQACFIRERRQLDAVVSACMTTPLHPAYGPLPIPELSEPTTSNADLSSHRSYSQIGLEPEANPTLSGKAVQERDKPNSRSLVSKIPKLIRGYIVAGPPKAPQRAALPPNWRREPKHNVQITNHLQETAIELALPEPKRPMRYSNYRAIQNQEKVRVDRKRTAAVGAPHKATVAAVRKGYHTQAPGSVSLKVPQQKTRGMSRGRTSGRSEQYIAGPPEIKRSRPTSAAFTVPSAARSPSFTCIAGHSETKRPHTALAESFSPTAAPSPSSSSLAKPRLRSGSIHSTGSNKNSLSRTSGRSVAAQSRQTSAIDEVATHHEDGSRRVPFDSWQKIYIPNGSSRQSRSVMSGQTCLSRATGAAISEQVHAAAPAPSAQSLEIPWRPRSVRTGTNAALPPAPLSMLPTHPHASASLAARKSYASFVSIENELLTAPIAAVEHVPAPPKPGLWLSGQVSYDPIAPYNSASSSRSASEFETPARISSQPVTSAIQQELPALDCAPSDKRDSHRDEDEKDESKKQTGDAAFAGVKQAHRL